MNRSRCRWGIGPISRGSDAAKDAGAIVTYVEQRGSSSDRFERQFTVTGDRQVSRLNYMQLHTTNCIDMKNGTRLPKVIWKQAASLLLLADPLIVTARNRSTVFASWRQ